MTMKPKHNRKLNSIPEIADRADVSVKTVRRWISSGELVAIRIGSVVRISDDDFDIFLMRHRDA